MQFTIEENLLAPALQALQKTLGVPTLPASTCIYIEADEKTGKIHMHSTDGLFHTITRVPAKEIKTAGEALVDGKLFTGLVRTFSAGEIQVKADKAHTILVQQGKNKTRVSGIAPSNVIEEPILGQASHISLPKPILENAILSIDFARLKKAHQASDYKFCEVGFTIQKDLLTLMTTDKHRVAVARIPITNQPELDIVIPYKAFADVLASGGQQVEILVSDRNIRLESGGIIYYCPLLEGNFPRYDKFVTRQTDMIEVNRNELLSALQRADLVTQRDDDIPGGVLMELDQNTLHLSGETSMGSQADELLDVVTTISDPRKAMIYGRYLLDAAKRIKTDTVDLYLDADSKRPILTFPKGSDEIGYMTLALNLE